MGNSIGRNLVSPKPLAEGMAVVVFIKPCYPLLFWEKEAGIVTGKWLKGEIKLITSDGWYSIQINKDRIAINWKDTIIVRSVAYADNMKGCKVREKLAVQAKRQRRELLASMKVVRSTVS